MQRERALAAQGVPAGVLHLGGRLVEDRGARTQGRPEGLLLGVGHLRDAVPVAVQVGVRLAHLVAAEREQLGHRRVVVPQQAHRPDRPAQQAPQHVTATLVAGCHAVGDQHQAAADVVGDDPHPDVRLVVVAVPPAGELLGTLDDGVHHVDLVHVVDTLEEVRHALQPHAGVDVLPWQGAGDVEVVLGAEGAELVLHEHEVPDLEVAVLELGRHREPLGGLELTVGAVIRAAVVEDLRRRAAGSRHAHRPVVLLRAELDDALARQAGDLHPQMQRLVVPVQDRRPQPALLQAEPALALGLGDQLPGVLDGAFLEVVAEREVAAHLEERAVPGRLADVLDVGGADALLHAHRPVVRRRLLTEEVRLERHHPRVHEQQRRVVDDQGRRGYGGVRGGLEVRHEPSPDLRGVHQLIAFLSRLVGCGLQHVPAG